MEQFLACRADDVKKVVDPLPLAGCQQAHGVTLGHTPSHVVFVLRDADNEPFAFCAFEPKALEAMLELDSTWVARND